MRLDEFVEIIKNFREIDCFGIDCDKCKINDGICAFLCEVSDKLNENI